MLDNPLYYNYTRVTGHLRLEERISKRALGRRALFSEYVTLVLSTCRDTMTR